MTPQDTKDAITTVALNTFRPAPERGSTHVDVELMPGGVLVDASGVALQTGGTRGLYVCYRLAVQDTWGDLPREVQGSSGRLTLAAHQVPGKPGLWDAIWCRQEESGYTLVVEKGVIRQEEE